jgi:AcrR family transcriptional regulator
MRKRADDVAETRQRIVEAAVRLHGTIGPAATTVSALAAEAAVTRLTVYRHFPDDLSLFSACSQHWAASQTFPDPERWKQIDDREVRVTTGLTDVYRFYREAEPMLTKVRRDQAALPGEIRDRTIATEQSYCDALASGFPARGHTRELICATVHHAVSYWTWHSLCVSNRMKDEDAVTLMTALVMAASESNNQ